MTSAYLSRAEAGISAQSSRSFLAVVNGKAFVVSEVLDAQRRCWAAAEVRPRKQMVMMRIEIIISFLILTDFLYAAIFLALVFIRKEF